MTTTEINLAALPVTRFDVRDTGNGTELRLFSKRVKVGAFDVEEVVLEDWEAKLTAYIASNPTANYEEVEFFLTNEEEELEGEIEEDREPGSIIPEKYREIYGASQRCGDDISEVLTAYVTTGRTNRKDPEAGLDRVKLYEVCELNSIGHRLATWEEAGLNGGLLRMNASNVLRGMVRRGERVVIGTEVWAADPSKMEARLARRKEARLEAKAMRKAARV